MSDIAIRVENLSKLYRIGARQNRHDSLRHTLTDALASPFRRLWRNPKSEIRNPKSEDAPFRRVKLPDYETTDHKTTDQSSSVSGQVVSSHVVSGQDDYIWALKDVSFEVKRGEVVGIIGYNGAGKTTLLKILSRITEPTEGRAEIYGRVGSLLEIGTGFQQELTGRENIYLSGAILGMKWAEIHRKFDEMVAFAGIEKFIDTPVKRYSTGMYMRLAFAVAAHLHTEILLVDEVLSVGDALFQSKCLGKMSAVAGEGRTVLFVSHNMAAITALTQRCILLKDGRLDIDGDTPFVSARYLADSASTAHPSVVNLREGIRRTADYPLEVQLTELILTDSNGIPRGQFYEGDPINLSISFDVKRPIQQFEIACAVSTSTGVRLFSVASGRRPWSASPGSYTMTTVFDPNPLRPGIYNLSIGIQSSAWQDGGYDVASFEIIDNPNQKEKNYPIYGNFGVLYLPYTWRDPTRSRVSA